MESKKDDKVLISKKIDSEIKKYSILKSSFTKISENELALSKTRVKSFENISNIEETDNTYLKEIYNNFSSTMKDLENLKKKQMDKINELIIPATVYYPEKCKGIKIDLEKINQIDKNKIKNVEEIKKAEIKKDMARVSQLNSQLTQFENNSIVEGNNLEFKLTEFESERLTDNKYLLLHYIHSELAYHATALEKLTTLYGDIMMTDPKELLPNFVKNYNLQSFKEKDAKLMANQFGYKIGETERKRQEKEKMKDPNYQNQLSSNRGMLSANPNPRPMTPNQKGNAASVLKTMDEDGFLKDTITMNNNLNRSKSQMKSPSRK